MANQNSDNLEFPNLVLLESNLVVSHISMSAAPDSFKAPNAAGKLRKTKTKEDVRNIAKKSAMTFSEIFCK